MTKDQLKNSVFLIVYRDPDLKQEPSIELIECVTTRTVETIDTKNYTKRIYHIQIRKDGKVIFPNIQKVECLAKFTQGFSTIKRTLDKRRRELFFEKQTRQKLFDMSIQDLEKMEDIFRKIEREERKGF